MDQDGSGLDSEQALARSLALQVQQDEHDGQVTLLTGAVYALSALCSGMAAWFSFQQNPEVALSWVGGALLATPLAWLLQRDYLPIGFVRLAFRLLIRYLIVAMIAVAAVWAVVMIVL